MNDLAEVVKILKSGVRTIPMDKIAQSISEMTSPDNTQDFAHKGRNLRAILTRDEIGPKKIWHLSIGVLDGQPLDEDVVKDVIDGFSEFFLHPVELPAVLHDKRYVRHFIELA